MNRQNYRAEDGFTLIELLMVIGIFGILMMAMQAMFLAGTNILNREQRESEARQQAYIAIEEMVKLIRTTPASNVTLGGTVSGVYDEITLTSSTGVQTRFYSSGSQVLRESAGSIRIVADGIELLRFEVKCDVDAGVFETYDAVNLQVTDVEADFGNRDPRLQGMVVRFENETGGLRYIYRKITDVGTNSLKIDSDFVPALQPTNRNYAIGKTYQIYLKTAEIPGRQKGTEVLTGVAPRF